MGGRVVWAFSWFKDTMPIQTVDNEGLRGMIKKWTLDTTCSEGNLLFVLNFIFILKLAEYIISW